MSKDKKVKGKDSPTFKKLEESLGINSDDKDDDLDDTLEDLNEVSEEDREKEEREEKIKARREIVKNTRNLLATVKKDGNLENEDEAYIRDMLRDLSATGMSMLKVQEEEMQLDPSARNAETAASLINAISSSLKELQEVSLKRKKLELDEQKVNIRKVNANPNGGGVTNIIGAGTFADIVKQLKNEGADIGKTGEDAIDVDAEVVETDDEDDD